MSDVRQDTSIDASDHSREPADDGWWGYLQQARASAELDGTAGRSMEEIEAARRAFRTEQSDGPAHTQK